MNRKKNYKIILIIVGLLVGLPLAYFRLTLYVSHPDLSVREYLTCVFSLEVKARGPFLITQTGVCVQAHICERFGGAISCRNREEDDYHGWKIAKGLSKGNFNFDWVQLKERGYEIIDDTNDWEYRDGRSYVRHGNAWFVDVNDTTYFWWPTKGNGRLFSIDRKTFEYKGNDVYQDKDGLIEKNTRAQR